jgi:hypothetical protein
MKKINAALYCKIQMKQEIKTQRRWTPKNKVGDNWYLLCFIFLLTSLNLACENSSLSKKPSNTETTVNAENKQSAFESDLQTMRTANFEYIFVFRRKDGAAFDGEDRKFLRANSPAETNRFVSTDDGKAFIAGSKYKFPPQNLEILRSRFNIEDYSAIQETN